MKKLFGLLALVLAVVSCQNDFEGTKIGGDEVAVTLNVAVPDDATRAAGEDSALSGLQNINLETGYDIRYILEVYDERGTLAKERIVNREDVDASTSFDLRLVPGRDYRFVVWADFIPQNQVGNGDFHYNTTNIQSISLNGEQKANDESRDAYTCVRLVEDFKSGAPIEIELKRPFAKLRVVTTDIEQLYSDLTSVTVAYTTPLYTTFNALTEEKGGLESVANTTKVVDLTNLDYVYVEQEYKNAGKMTLFADYFFGAEDDAIHFTLDATDATGMDIPEVQFNTNIPVQRNYLTTVMGPVLTDAANVTVEIKVAFEESEIEIIEHSGYINEPIRLATGAYIFRDLNMNLTNDNAIIIEENANVTIDIVGKVNLKAAKEAIKVSKGATLTINGVQATRSNTRHGELVADGGIGVDVDATININNIAKLTAKGHGDHAFGIGGTHANVNIYNTNIDYVSGGHIQPLFVNDEKYGKSEPEGGAAIGGKSIVIKNSTIVKAEGGSKAAAIGNSYHQSTEVVIEDSVLGDIFGGNASAAIGGSRYASGISADNKQITKIRIEGSTIENAVGGQFGAGIGSGYDTHCAANETNSENEIVIVDSEINAQGGKYAAGIGTGFHAASLTGSIDTDSEIVATSGEPFYKSTYTFAQHVGYGVIDPAREGADLNVTFNVKGNTIEVPAVYTAYYFVTNIDELNAALENVVEGTNTIVLGANIEGTATVAQIEGADIIIDGNNHKFDGTINIHGSSRHTGTETLTIKNINFESNSAKYFIDSNSTKEPERYAHNVTIKDCTFTNLTGVNDTAVCGARFRQAYNVKIDGCTATDTFFLAWFTGCSNITINNCIATNNQEGITFGAGDTSIIKDSNIQAELFGVRIDPTDKYAHNVTIENCTLSGFIPVSARNLTEGKKPINVTFNGENTLTKGEDSLYDVVFSSNEYKSGVNPEAPISEFSIEGAEGFNVYGIAVAKVGNTPYYSFNDALAAWTNNTTLTLLSDVTLSDVITLKSTEHHILDLGTFTMTAADGKNAFVIKACGTGDAERTAITIKADATSPGCIDAKNKCIVYYKYADGGITGNDRPIIKIEGGIFKGTTSTILTAGIYTIGSEARKCATLNISGGTFNCSINGSGKSKLIISGGLFHYSVGSQGDSTALRLISGGTFKTLGFMTADTNNTKFWFGTSMGNSNVGVYINDEGYLVVGGPVLEKNDENDAKFEAWTSTYKWSNLLKYSSAATHGLYFSNKAIAEDKKWL